MEVPGYPNASALPEDARLPPVGVEVTHVRGLIQTVVKRILANGLDGAAWKDFLSTLSPGAREQLSREVSEYEWVSMPALVEAVWKHPSGREGAVAVLRGSLYADLMMSEKHQWMLKIMTPELMVRQAPRIYAFYHRGGQMAAERVELGRATLTLRAEGPSSAWFGLLLPSWLQRSLELSGARGVETAYEPPEATGDPQLHRYWLTWA